MNVPSLEHYGLLLTQLLYEREAAGGDLPEEEESRYVELLDQVWWQLRPSDQEQLDRALKQVAVRVAEELNLVDQPVTEGSSDLPRRSA